MHQYNCLCPNTLATICCHLKKNLPLRSVKIILVFNLLLTEEAKPFALIKTCFKGAEVSSSQHFIFLSVFEEILNVRSHHHPDTNTRQRYYKKRKLQTNITNEYRCNNPQQNTTKQNPTTH